MAVQQDVNLKSKPTLAELLEYVRTNKWEDVGVQLRLDDTSLGAIRCENNHNIDDCRKGCGYLAIQIPPESNS